MHEKLTYEGKPLSELSADEVRRAMALLMRRMEQLTAEKRRGAGRGHAEGPGREPPWPLDRIHT